MAGSASVHFLLVDDDQDDRMFFKDASSELGIEVKISELQDGSPVISTLEMLPELPQVIVMDINMPELNGLDTLTHIRQHERFKDIPVVLMTTSADPAMISLGHQKGADRYVIKPTAFKDLKRLVKIIARDWETFRTGHDASNFVLNKTLKKRNQDSIL